MNEPLVEVIILHHEGLENIKRCLTSLKKTDYPNLIVTVVDQNSKDGTNDLIKKEYAFVNLVERKVNDSFSRGCNRILKESKAKYCILLNDDTEQHPDWISELVNLAEKNKSVATVQSKILSMKNRKMFEYAGAAGGHMDFIGYPICRGRIFSTIEEDFGQYEQPIEIFWSCGVSVLINMDVLKEIGYLDEDFGSYAEELDLCWRINLSGYKNLYCPKSIVYHLGSGTWGKKEFKLKKEFLLQRNHFILILKNYSLKSLLFVFPIKLFFEILTFFSFMLENPKKSLAVILSILSIIKNTGKIVSKNREISKIRKISDKQMFSKLISSPLAIHYFLFKNKGPFKIFEKYISYDGFKEKN